ncbi:MAG: DUF362 domain-containing protein [Syntrophomonadaceae bacterium]|nr:DUF362 domain-containing protein [Syntrophomonadaceae bacterium]
MNKAKVVVQHGPDPATLAYNAIKDVFDDDVRGKKVLLKPNTGRKGPARSGLCTHPEVIRGLISFFQENGAAEIYVGDGPLFGVDEWEALASAGIMDVCQETGATCVDLDAYQPVDMLIKDAEIADSLKVSSFMKQVDFVVSVPVIKTHMYTGVTLSIKNMKGCLYKKEKTKLHRIDKAPPDRSKGLTLDYGIADMAAILMPNYAVIDGIVCMEGFGPSAGSEITLDAVVASKNAIAADLVAIRLMGMGWDDVPHINLIRHKLSLQLEDIVVEPLDFMKFSKNFAPASQLKLKIVYPNINIVEKGACSACSATVMAFLKAHGDKFSGDLKFTLAAGKDLAEDDVIGDTAYLVGNCTAATAKKSGFSFCKGCPPVGSSLLSFITGKEAW